MSAFEVLGWIFACAFYSTLVVVALAVVFVKK